MCKVYISGPITNDPNYKKKFTEVGAKLALLGLIPVDPTEAPEGYAYKDYIDFGLEKLMECDMICMLPGYRESRGAMTEYMYAVAVRMPILVAEHPEEEWVILGR